MRLKLTFAFLTTVFALTFPVLLPTANGAASTVSMTQDCFAGAIEGRFKWAGNDVQAKEQWLDLSTFDNRWEAGTFQSEGPFTGRTTTYSWLDLAPDTVYYFRVTQQLSNGTWEASGTFTATTTPCVNSTGIKLALDRNARETLEALAAGLPPTTPPPGRVVGFSIRPVKEVAELTPPGGTLTGCSTGMLYALIQVPASTAPPQFYPFARGAEWTVDTKKSPWNLSGIVISFSGISSVSNGSVTRTSTFTFDSKFQPAPGLYEVRYGTGANAIEGKVTLAC
jgi:hypothetical protein